VLFIVKHRTGHDTPSHKNILLSQSESILKGLGLKTLQENTATINNKDTPKKSNYGTALQPELNLG